MAGAGGTMLGAELEGLSSLSTQLAQTSVGIGESRQSAQAVADQVVGELETTFSIAMSRITQTTQDLKATVDASRSQIDVTVWTGANAERFNAAGQEFSDSMLRVAAATDEAYEGFRTAMEGVRAHIVEHQISLGQNLAAAEDATTSMAGAVDSQHAVLDSAMNSGIGLA